MGVDAVLVGVEAVLVDDVVMCVVVGVVGEVADVTGVVVDVVVEVEQLGTTRAKDRIRARANKKQTDFFEHSRLITILTSSILDMSAWRAFYQHYH